MAAASRTGDNPIRSDKRKYDVDRALDRLLGRRQRRPLKLDPHRIADVGARALEQLCESSERHQRHRQREDPQPARQPSDVGHALGIDEQHDLFDV